MNNFTESVIIIVLVNAMFMVTKKWCISSILNLLIIIALLWSSQ